MTFLKYFRPQTLTGRLILLSIILLFTMQIIIITAFVIDGRNKRIDDNIKFSLVKIISIVRLLDNTNAKLYPEIIKANHGHGLFMYFSKIPLKPNVRNKQFEQRALNELGDENREIYIMTKDNNNADLDKFPIPKEGELHPVFGSKKQSKSFKIPSNKANFPIIEDDDKNTNIADDKHQNKFTPIFYGSIKLKNGQYLIFANMLPNGIVPKISSNILYTIISITLLGTLCFYLLIKEITSPLKKLTTQAEIISRDYQAKSLPIEGPLEIQELMISFNRMQKTLESFISDRTRIIAAISHDLKTPLTSMMLRAQFLPDSEDKEKMLSTIDVMTKMVKTTLSFARSEDSQQDAEDIHLPSLIESICDDYIDNNQNVSYIEKTPLIKSKIFHTRPIEIRRILQNLIDNALQYGTEAKVSIAEKENEILLEIEDNGPGIPENKFEEVFSPFTRLDKARNTNNAHVGLGLAIVRNTILKQGGTIHLANKQEGGLVVSIIYKL